MVLSIKDLLPTYFPEQRKSTSEIWGKNLQWNKGDLVKIVAPSGSGKTSLVHFLYGLRKDYTGDILYDDNKASQMSLETYCQYRKEKVSVIFQDMRLFPEQTVLENIDIKRLLDPYHPKEKIAEMAERLGIGDKLNSLSRTCSYGEQQRLVIIRALMQPFDFLLMDEPFSHLDENNSQKAMKLILEEAAKRNAAIIFADLERIDYFPFTQIYHL